MKSVMKSFMSVFHGKLSISPPLNSFSCIYRKGHLNINVLHKWHQCTQQYLSLYPFFSHVIILSLLSVPLIKVAAWLVSLCIGIYAFHFKQTHVSFSLSLEYLWLLLSSKSQYRVHKHTHYPFHPAHLKWNFPARGHCPSLTAYAFPYKKPRQHYPWFACYC